MTENPRQLNTLHGIRVLALVWVITGHSFSFPSFAGTKNISEIYDISYFQKNWFQLFLLNVGTISVDIFFVIGGILTGYLLVKKYKGKDVGFNFFVVSVVKRTMRFVPPIGAVILIAITFYLRPNAQNDEVRGYLAFPFPDNTLNLTQTGMFSSEYQAKLCQKMWWKTLFNLIWTTPDKDPNNTTCMAHLWYVSVDYWIFVVVIGLLVLYLNPNPKMNRISYILGALIFCGSVFFNLFISFYTEREWEGVTYAMRHERRNDNTTFWINEWWADIYFRPWARIPAYMIGVALGSYLIEWRKIVPDKKAMPGIQAKILVYWILSMVVLVIPIPAAYSLFYPKWFGELWAATWRFFYAYFFGMFVCNMEIAREGIFYDFFSSPKWYFFSRINFSTYRLVWLASSEYRSFGTF